MTAAISEASMFFSAACWRMMSSWRNGSVTSSSARSARPERRIASTAPSATTAAPGAARRVQMRPAEARVPERRREPRRLVAGRRDVRDTAMLPLSMEPGEQRRELALELLDAAVVDDHVVCPRRFLLLGQLARLALTDQRVAPCLRAPAPHLLRGRDGDGRIEDAVHSGLEEQRHLDRGELRARRQLGQPGGDPLSDQGMSLPLEPGELLRPREDDLTDSLAVDDPAGRDLGAPALRDPPPQGLRVQQLVRDGVAGDCRRTEATERRQRLRLPGRYAAGEADRQWPRHRAGLVLLFARGL